MTIYIALLRGINVGGHRLIKMADLRHLLEKMGLDKVQTYIQSGNVLFESEQDSKQLSCRIQHEIDTKFGFSVPVILRTSIELDQIIENCPFNVGTLLEGESIQLSLLAELPPREGVNHLLKFQNDTDEYQIEGENIYLFFRQSIRNSKLAAQLQKIGVPSTVRNWKTINKLATMAKAME
ncbi:DUF1697 domain-containing protein [Paenisporosarcina sp. TG20]|uniref:DUF1697 domain-containing protein n=1 Tax=Paenisporosarcina sp. TG20 TaxID=1211706 RepID=UPI00031C2220|nr:DUF1697 domain-containing protein [Paenisporosarcina sp. TG20]